ncbi:Uncharacterised protein [uncultured archaeon]|nr:Uncharacterised protein [uncultured archaeon]
MVKTMVKKFFNHYFYVAVILIIITVLFTYPIAFNMTSSFYGYPGDPLGTIWWIWWFKRSILELNTSPLFSPIVGAPDGIYRPLVTPIISLLSLPFAALYGEVFSYNFLILSSFVLSGIGMYSLAFYLIKNEYASLISSVIFAFSPYHVAHAMDHWELAQIQWIPFCLLYMFKLDKDRNYKNAVIFGIFFIVVMFSNWYYTLFTLLLIITYFLYRAFTSKLFHIRNFIQCFNVKNLKIVGIIFFIVGIPTLTVYYYFVEPALFSFQQIVPERDIYELLVYSAKPWDLFLPPVYHPIFGRYVQEFVLLHLYGSNPVEQILYIGFAPFILAIYAVFKFINNKKSGEHQVVVIFTLFALLSLGFMMPPYLPIGNLKIPISLSYLLHMIAPSFRVISRFDLILMLSVSMLAGIGTKYLLEEKLKTMKISSMLIILIIILFEFAPIPSNISQIKRPEQVYPFEEHEYEYHTTKIIIPQEYYWLASQKEDFTIIEYPVIIPPSNMEILDLRYLFYQRIHKKKLVNGGSEKILKNLAEINETSANMLKKMGVKYAVVHTEITGKNINTTGFEIIKKFNNTLILEPQ